jgi:Exopolysaccharide synthesis, ExoD
MLSLGLLATTPVGSTVPGLILAVMLILGRAEPVLPHFITIRRLPTKHLLQLGGRGIHILKHLEKAVHPRWPMTFDVTKRAVGTMVLLLTVVLLLTPVPLSNIAPAMVISLPGLYYRDWISSDLGNNCRRGPYQRLGILGQPDDRTLGGSLYTSSGHSSSTSSRISLETSERPSVSNRNLCSRSKSSCTMMWSEIIRGA